VGGARERECVCVCACLCVCVCMCMCRVVRLVEHCSNIEVWKRRIECALKPKHIWYVWGRVCMGSCMYGVVYAWGRVCMGSCMYGVVYVWGRVCMHGIV